MPPPVVDEVEPAALELERQLVDVGLEEDPVRHPLAGNRRRFGGDVDPCYERAQLGELGGRLTGRALQVKYMLALDLGQAARGSSPGSRAVRPSRVSAAAV
jgi:hypothetical protein